MRGERVTGTFAHVNLPPATPPASPAHAALPGATRPIQALTRISPLAIFGGLVAGVASGILLGQYAPALASGLRPVLDVIGTLWLRALQMTIVPLVVAMLVTGIVQSVAAARAGRIAGASIALFFAVLWTGAILAAIVTPLLLGWFPVPEAARSALAAGLASADVGQVPPFTEIIKKMVPTNPITSAAETDILPLIIFTGVFALAITRLEPASRDRLSGLFAALADTMLVMIGWVLRIAPVGVFALAFVTAIAVGPAAIGVYLHYILIVSTIGMLVWALAYPMAAFFGKRRLSAFARAVLPAQSVAFSTQSSLASLPAMVEGATALGVRPAVSEVTLPLAVALFRSTGPAMNLAVAIYIAYLTGVQLTPGTLAIGVAVAATTTLGAVSLPGTISFFSSIAPIAVAMGVPVAPLALLVGVETLPDIIRTLGNVSNDTAAATVIDARSRDNDVAEA